MLKYFNSQHKWDEVSVRGTSEDVVLVVLVRLRADLDETLKAIVVDKLVDQVLVILRHSDGISDGGDVTTMM